MGRRTLIFGLALTFVLFGTTAFAQTFGAVLTGSQENPPTTSPGFGNFIGSFDSGHANLTVTLTVANLGAPINNFHIHEKASGSQSGPVIINLIGLGGVFINNKMTGTFPVTSDVAARMLAYPSSFYVNVHTTQFPGGAIRGDLAITSGTVITYAADLRGSNEVPPNSSTAFGSAFITIDTVSNTLFWEVNESGIVSPTLSHIHGQAAAGANASVLISFATSASAFTGGRLTGSISIAGLSSDNLNTLLTHPPNFSINAPSIPFPGARILGQLTLATEYDLAIAGHVTNALGQTFVTDARVFNPSYDTATTALLEYFHPGTSPTPPPPHPLPATVPPPRTASLDPP